MTKGGFWHVGGRVACDKLLAAVVARRVGVRLAMSIQPGAGSGPKVMHRLQVASLASGNWQAGGPARDQNRCFRIGFADVLRKRAFWLQPQANLEPYPWGGGPEA